VAAGQAGWLDRLDAELGNLRAAIAFSLAQPDPEPGLRLAASLRMYWKARGHAAEGADVLRALLDMPAAQEATLTRARALEAAARLLFEATGSSAIAEDYCEEALAIARAVGDEYLVAELLYHRAFAAGRGRQDAAALPLIESGLGLARRIGEPHLTANLLSARAYITYAEGDLTSAARDAGEALQLSRQAGDQLQVGAVLGNLGVYELAAGDLDAARRHLAEALDIVRTLDDRPGIVQHSVNLGLTEYLSGDPGAAEALFADSLDRARRIGMKVLTAYALLGLALASRGGADRRGADRGEADPGRSARLHGAADQALADLGHALEPIEAGLADLDRERLRAAMGAEAFEAEYAAGRRLDPACAADLARSARLAEPAGTRASEPDAPDEAVTVLTPRELDVLKLVAQGLSNRDIGRRLSLSEHTVKRHLANILHKLSLPSRAAAAAWGAHAHLI
jgi:ATP/maltotriose-dependent transcriptional regulator MalT